MYIGSKIGPEIKQKSMKFVKIIKHDYVSLAEAATGSGYSADYLRLRARQGKLKAKKINGLWFTTRAWLKEYNHICKDKVKPHSPGVNDKSRINIYFLILHSFDVIIYKLSLIRGYYSHSYQSKKIKFIESNKLSFVSLFYNLKLVSVLIFAFFIIYSASFLNTTSGYSSLYVSYINEVKASCINLSLELRQLKFDRNISGSHVQPVTKKFTHTSSRALNLQIQLGSYMADSVLPVIKLMQKKVSYLINSYPIFNYNLRVYNFWDEVLEKHNVTITQFTFQAVEQQYYKFISNLIMVPSESSRSIVKEPLQAIYIQPRVLGESDFKGKFPQVNSISPKPRAEIINITKLKLLD